MTPKYQLRLAEKGKRDQIKIIDLFEKLPGGDDFNTSICTWKEFEFSLIVNDSEALKNFDFNGARGSIEFDDDDSNSTSFKMSARFESGNEFEIAVNRADIFNEMYGSLRFQIVLGSEGRSLVLFSELIDGRIRKEQKVALEKMAKELLECKSEAVNWMLVPKRGGSNAADSPSYLHSQTESEKGEETSEKVLPSYAELISQCYEILEVYENEANKSFFRLRPHSKVLSRPEMINAESVTTFGREEAQWLAKNTDSFYAVNYKTPFKFGRRNYMPKRLMSDKRYASYNISVNQVIVAFIREVLGRLTVAEARLEEFKFQKFDSAGSKEAEGDDNGYSSQDVIKEIWVKPIDNYLEKIKGLKRRVQKVCVIYESAMPKLDKIKYKFPRRSKIFQEEKPYFEFHELMRKWLRFDDSDEMREDFALSTSRLDKLYEYYVLLEFLKEFERGGYEPKELLCYEYKKCPWFYNNEKQARNFYCMTKGASQIKLFYEPVVSTGSSKKHDLVRTDDGMFWIPDYYLIFEDGEGEKFRFIFDAKFSNFGWVSGNRSGFNECMKKYKINTAVQDDGLMIDAMWLLYGIQKGQKPDARLNFYQSIAWTKDLCAGKTIIPDGIAPVAPGANRLHELLVKLGVVDE